MPTNIERRAHRGSHPNARYRGWDGAGRFYWISGQSGAWRASPRDEGGQPAYAPTLDALSSKLSAIN